ncbi:MAG: GntR family transcriptional regulator [Verrucomicrobiaceae bacterium]|nr:MAG: GntR family transcriptional regulator [Verrucomicrobiaceae bacterium]
MAELGKMNRLPVARDSVQGLYLDGGEDGEILLPRRFVPPTAGLDDVLEVFVHRDSEDRLVATTQRPLAMDGDFAALEVAAWNPGIGAFLSWGLDKDLLLPMNEQVGYVAPGDRIVVRVYVDRRSHRMAASMRLDRFLDRTPPYFDNGQKVSLMIVSETDLGCKAIVENTHWGLLYRTALAFPLVPGQKLEGYVQMVRPDGKIDLTLDPAGYQRVKPLAEQILEMLKAQDGYLPYDDSSPPEEIRDVFQTSKKAFKQALGALFRDRRIRFESPGIRLNPHNPPKRR